MPKNSRRADKNRVIRAVVLAIPILFCLSPEGATFGQSAKFNLGLATKWQAKTAGEEKSHPVGSPRKVKAEESRYFLSFIAHSGALGSARLEGEGPAFVTLTRMDKYGIRAEALGYYLTSDVGTFGPVPTELYKRPGKEQSANQNVSDVTLRVELTAAEYDRVHKVWSTWDKRARTGMLLYSIPQLNLIVFLTRIVDNLNWRGARLSTHKLDWSVADEMATKYNLPQIPFQYIKELRRLNDTQHVKDEMLVDGRHTGLRNARNAR